MKSWLNPLINWAISVTVSSCWEGNYSLAINMELGWPGCLGVWPERARPEPDYCNCLCVNRIILNLLIHTHSIKLKWRKFCRLKNVSPDRKNSTFKTAETVVKWRKSIFWWMLRNIAWVTWWRKNPHRTLTEIALFRQLFIMGIFHEDFF